MTNSFNSSMPYNAGVQNFPQNDGYYQPIQNQYYTQKPSVVPAIVTASAIGFIGGTGVSAAIHYFKGRKPVSSDGTVKDSFAKQVLDRMISKDYVAKGKEYFKQQREVLKKLGKISTPEAFTKLMNKNRVFCKSLCDGISLDSMCKTVTKDNIKSKISSLKTRIETSMKQELQNVKDTISLCWDKENKKFVKSGAVEEKIYKIIKSAKSSFPWKSALKCGGITAGVFGALTLGLAAASNRSRQ